MIEQISKDGHGSALFSDDMVMRYRLKRRVAEGGSVTCTFVLLNPSTADAFKPDPTVSRCCEFARRWGCHLVEVVNLFAFRSPYPADLYQRTKAGESIGGDFTNTMEIGDAAMNADIVIAAWGAHGRLNDRAAFVTEALESEGVKLQALRRTDGGFPSHPLARGKSFVPYNVERISWP